MKIKIAVLILFGVTTIFCCNSKNDKTKDNSSNKKETISEVNQLSKAQDILNKTIEAHGGDLYLTADYTFDFRGNKYRFKNNGIHFEYTKKVQKGDTLIEDLLKNKTFSRLINSEPTVLSDKTIKSATEGLNSVIYFATLPYKLNDKAVNKSYIGDTIIKEKNYYIISITFNQDNGGEDFDDKFYYWINKSNHKIDYLAYSYNVNDGGVRFRSAYNARVIDGITFQDYINYKANVGTPLRALPKLYEAGKLKELSKIKTENIINLNK